MMNKGGSKGFERFLTYSNIYGGPSSTAFLVKLVRLKSVGGSNYNCYSFLSNTFLLNSFFTAPDNQIVSRKYISPKRKQDEQRKSNSIY